MSRRPHLTRWTLVLGVLAGACGFLRDATDEHDTTALMRAARDGDGARVALLIDGGARVNQSVRGHNPLRVIVAVLSFMQQLPDREAGYTALHYAAADGHEEALTILLAHGADPERASKSGRTPLSLAARAGSLPSVAKLLEEGAAVRRPPGPRLGRPWQPPLSAAALGRPDPELVELLLVSGADPDAEPAPLVEAAARGSTATVRLLLEYEASLDARGRRGRTALIEAAFGGHAEVVALLVEAGADPSLTDERAGWTAAEWAASRQHADVLAALGLEGAPASTELVRAVQTHDAERVRELLAAGASADTRTATGSTVLSVSVYSGDVTTTRILLDAGARIDLLSLGQIPLVQRAAQTGPLELVGALLGAGADATAPGTATYAAAGGEEILRLVHEAGADIHEELDEPLRYAAINGRVDAVRYLLEQGVSPDAADSHGRTPLGRSVAMREPDATRVLLEAGADPNRTDPSSGWTPLMSAAMGGDSVLIGLLLGAGADPDAVDHDGRSAADFALGAGNGHVIPLLRRRR